MTRLSAFDTTVPGGDPRPERVRRWLLPSRITGLAAALVACGSPADDTTADLDPFHSEDPPFDYGQSAEVFFDHAGLEVTFLEGTVFHFSPALGLPDKLAVGEGTLWVADYTTDPGLHAINIENGELLHSFGPRGEGPGEFAGYPWGLQVLSSDPGAVWAWDPDLQRVARFEPKPVSEYEIVTAQLEIRKPVGRIVWVSPDRILGTSASETERFSFFSASGEHQGFVPGDLLGPVDVPNEARIGATNQGIQLCAWPGKGFVIASINVGRIELYDEDANLVRLADVPFPSEPIFEPDRQGIIRFRSPRRFYYGCAANEDLLFAVFSGRLESEYEGHSRNSGEFLHVFDWDGKLRSVFRLDQEVYQIAVDRDGAILYAGSMVEGAVYRYVLPPISR